MISQNDPDFRLIQKAKAGNSVAFGKLVEKYQDQILNLVYDFTGDFNGAKDIAQEVFVKVFVKIASFEGRSNFATWLYRVAVNTCLDEARKKKKKSFRLFSGRDTLEKIKDSTVTDVEEQPEIDFKLEKLSEKQRTAVVLRYYNDMRVSDIAQIMECSENTVRTHIYRAIEKLKKVINK